MTTIPDHNQPLFEHVEKTYPGLKLFSQWESHTVDGGLETRVFIFDLERDAQKPVYVISLHSRDLSLVLLGDKLVVPFSAFSVFLRLIETGEKPNYPLANY